MSAPGERWPGRLGIYVDDIYDLRDGPDGPGLVADAHAAPFLRFACEVGTHFDDVLLFGRRRHGLRAGASLPAGVGFVPLPDYPSLRRLAGVTRAAPATACAMWRGLARVDAVWAFGPHPFALGLAGLARARGRAVVLGVRQEGLAYFRSRLPSRQWSLALLPAAGLDLAFRGIARRLPTTAVGAELAQRYGAPRPHVLAMTVATVRERQVASEPPRPDWDEQIELLTVARLEPEKNPLLLIDAIGRLERLEPGRHRLTWIGEGRMMETVRRRVARLGLSERVELVGSVPHGPELLRRYRRAHALVHVSLTEGVPQVIVEALAAGTPVVATAVGGVGAALERGAAGLLVPPGDAPALVEAIQRLRSDPPRRERAVARGLEIARATTLESEAQRVAAFIAAALRASRRGS